MNWSAKLACTLADFNLEVQLEGTTQFTTIIGPNGAGKTTVLRALVGAHRQVDGFEDGCFIFLYPSRNTACAAAVSQYLACLTDSKSFWICHSSINLSSPANQFFACVRAFCEPGLLNQCIEL